MGNCKSDPTYQQLQKFVNKGLGRMLSMNSLKIENEIQSVQDKDMNEKFIKLVSISIKQNKYFYDLLERIFQRFGFPLPQNFKHVEMSYTQELKELSQKISEKNQEITYKLFQLEEQLKNFHQKVNYLQNLKPQKSRQQVEIFEKDQQQINMLKRVILKHEKNSQNDKKLINELKSEMQNLKRQNKMLLRQQEKNKQLQNKINQLQKELSELKENQNNSKVKVKKSEFINSEITNSKQIDQNEQSQSLSDSRRIEDIKQELKREEEKLTLISKEILQKTKHLENLSLQISEKEQKLIIIKEQSDNMVLEKQLPRRKASQEGGKPFVEETKHSQYAQTDYFDGLEIISDQQDKLAVCNNQQTNHESEQITELIPYETPFSQSTTNEGQNQESVLENIRLSDENKAEVNEMLTKNPQFSPWKGFLNKFVVDLGVTMNAGITYGLYRRTNLTSSGSKSQTTEIV